MFETLIFNETRQKPTRDKKSYEPYPVKEIAIVSQNSLRITCLNEDTAIHSAQCVASILTGRHFSRNEEFNFKRGEIERHENQFTLEGDLRGLIGVLAQVSCISDELRDAIYKDGKFSQLSPEKPAVQYDEDELTGLSPEPVRRRDEPTEPMEAYAEKFLALIKTQEPELWETLSTSPEKRAAFLAVLDKGLDNTPRRENRSPSFHVK